MGALILSWLLSLFLVAALLGGAAIMLLGCYGWVVNDRRFNWAGRIWWWTAILGYLVFDVTWALGNGHWSAAALFAIGLLGCLGRLCVLLARRYEVRT